MIIFSNNNHVHLLTITATPSSFILTTSSLTICETSPRWLAYRYSRLMATKSLLAKKTVCQGLNARGLPSMPQDAEAEASDNCVLYWLSTRLDIQTVNLATASLPTHTCFTILLLFDCKIFSVISGGFVQVRCIASPHTFRTALLYGHRTNPM